MDAAVETTINGVVSTITGKYEMLEGLDVALYSLQQEVMKIKCAVNAARRRRITDEDFLTWLASLIDAVYLGSYYIRTFKSRSSHSRMITREGTSYLDITPSCRAAKRLHTIKTLIFGDEELRKLHDTLNKLKSIDTHAFILLVNAQPEWPIRIYKFTDYNRVYSREKEKEQVLNFLFEPAMTGKNNVDVLHIVGGGSAGKTTLALHCFFDSKVQGHFSVKIYNHVSVKGYPSNLSYPKSRDFRSTLQNILESCNIANVTHSDDENALIAVLKKRLSSERFVLFLDNIWFVDSVAWNALWDCLRGGEPGSKVILICNYEDYNNYKKIINSGEAKPIILDCFSEDEYMLFFKEHAFGIADAEDYPELEKIGREIAKALNGSIWGAKIFGELLRDNLNAQFWTNILQHVSFPSETFPRTNDLFVVLEIIYRLLPKCQPQVKVWGSRAIEEPLGCELQSYRELMVVGSNYCKPVKIEGKNRLEFLVTKHVFLNKRYFIEAFFDF